MNPIMAAVHKMKKKKRTQKKLGDLEEEAKEFLSQMERAADVDDWWPFVNDVPRPPS